MNSYDHRILKLRAMHRLLAKRYGTVFEPYLKGGGRIDVVGIKINYNKSHKVGVECEVTPSRGGILKKIKKYSEYVDKLYFAIFDDIDFNMEGINIWRFPRSVVLKNKIFLFEVLCKKCQQVFFCHKDKIKHCPYCHNDTDFSIEYEINESQNTLLKYPDNFRSDLDKKKNILLLKRPLNFEADGLVFR